MTTWIVDIQDRVGQRVTPDAQCNSDDRRFRKVSADRFSEALTKAQREVQCLKCLDEIQAGKEVVMSDADLDWLIDQGLHPIDVVSMPNPERVGILDAYLVGKVTCPRIAAYRAMRW